MNNSAGVGREQTPWLRDDRNWSWPLVRRVVGWGTFPAGAEWGRTPAVKSSVSAHAKAAQNTGP